MIAKRASQISRNGLSMLITYMGATKHQLCQTRHSRAVRNGMWHGLRNDNCALFWAPVKQSLFLTLRARLGCQSKPLGAYHLTEKSCWGVESIMVSDLPVYRRNATSVTV